MEKIKVTLISTVLNEEDSIEIFLASIASQTHLPDEVIIVDGGSSDRTIERINQSIHQLKAFSKIAFKVLTQRGNRAVGRNKAIQESNSDFIAIADAGCILDKNWLEELIKPFKSGADVVAGYYKGKSETLLQKCLVPYILVMPDKVDEQNFLPATRSMALKKSVWKNAGGFPEKYSHNEDYVFARILHQKRYSISFVKKAIVFWIPPASIRQAYVMFYRFARGDIQAGITRPKVVLLILRYILALIMVIMGFLNNAAFLAAILVLLALYIFWSINKNIRYIKDPRAIFILPFIQILSDIAVIHGTILGSIDRIWGIQEKQ